MFSCKTYRIPTYPLLDSVTFFYFFIPYVIFYCGYLKPWIVLLWAISLFPVFKELYHRYWRRPVDRTGEVLISNHLLLALAVITFFWVYLSGVGHFAFTNGDYVKHAAILHDLIQSEWPVAYQTEGNTLVYLNYYFAYYLPAAVAGKIAGIQAAMYVQYLWACLGVALAFCWVIRIMRQGHWGLILLFVGFSGLDSVGYLVTQHELPELFKAPHLEWWSGSFQYSANISLMAWVPQHAIPGWCLSAVVVDRFLREKTWGGDHILWYSLCAFWSPFILLGLLPLVAVNFLTHQNKKSFFSVANTLGAGTLFVLTGLFYFAGILDHKAGPVWGFGIQDLPSTYAWFVTLEALIYLVFLVPVWSNGDTRTRMLIACTGLCLLLIPLYVFGMYNDWCMRVSIPSLFFLQILLFRHIYQVSYAGKKGVMAALFAVWGIGMLTGFPELYRAVIRPASPPFQKSVSQMNSIPIAAQYFGAPEAAFYKYLTRPYTTTNSLPEAVLDYLETHRRR